MSSLLFEFCDKFINQKDEKSLYTKNQVERYSSMIFSARLLNKYDMQHPLQTILESKLNVEAYSANAVTQQNYLIYVPTLIIFRDNGVKLVDHISKSFSCSARISAIMMYVSISYIYQSTDVSNINTYLSNSISNYIPYVCAELKEDDTYYMSSYTNVFNNFKDKNKQAEDLLLFDNDPGIVPFTMILYTLKSIMELKSFNGIKGLVEKTRLASQPIFILMGFIVGLCASRNHEIYINNQITDIQNKKISELLIEIITVD
jgi:hypothetical protein